MEKIAFCICWSDDLENFPHVVKYTTALSCKVVVTMALQIVLDFGECLLNRIEVRRVRREVNKTNA
jgi:hypothetical protein